MRGLLRTILSLRISARTAEPTRQPAETTGCACTAKPTSIWAGVPERISRRAKAFEISRLLWAELTDEVETDLLFKTAVWLEQDDEPMPEHPRYSGFGPERGPDE